MLILYLTVQMKRLEVMAILLDKVSKHLSQALLELEIKHTETIYVNITLIFVMTMTL